MSAVAHQPEGTSLPEDHSIPALVPPAHAAPPPLVLQDAAYDTLAAPTSKGRRRPGQHLDPADDYDPDLGY